MGLLLLMGQAQAEQYRNDSAAIEARIKPHGQVAVHSTESPAVQPLAVTAEPQEAQAIGAVIYDRHCDVCHEVGIAGAPKYRDAVDWTDRSNIGMPTLLKHVVEGYNAMPAMGTCMNCTEEQLEAAIEYMLPQ